MNQATIAPAKKIIYKDNYEKGKAFEQYLIGLFNKRKFRVKKWREAKNFGDRIQSVDHHFPDVEMELIFSAKRADRFAVECKWRKRFYNGCITWANDDQICNYRIFQSQARMSVFIAIGIGGDPSAPEKLFITPLDHIAEYNSVYESQLIPFKRRPTSELLYDSRQLTLFQDNQMY